MRPGTCPVRPVLRWNEPLNPTVSPNDPAAFAHDAAIDQFAVELDPIVFGEGAVEGGLAHVRRHSSRKSQSKPAWRGSVNQPRRAAAGMDTRQQTAAAPS